MKKCRWHFDSEAENHGPILVNSYPTYFERLPKLVDRINREKRNSKNYVLFLGETNPVRGPEHR